MTTFAAVFMLTSMTLVTLLTAYCLTRILRSDVQAGDEPAASLPPD